MSLDKAIQHKKEFRKKYHDSREVDRTCRNHGSCPWCQSTRLFNYRKTNNHSQYDLAHYDED